jgi:hypothetical protein
MIPNFRAIDLTVRDDAALRRVARQIFDVYAARNGGDPSAPRTIEASPTFEMPPPPSVGNGHQRTATSTTD